MFDKPEGRSPDYWRHMAEEARTMADGLTAETNRQHMFAIAESYDRLAEQAEREQKRRG
jgi:predicted P-loop ATPase/GTPase